MIENTRETTSPAVADRILMEARLGNATGAIEAMEKRGQQQLVASILLPTEGSEDLAALGFTLGEVNAADPMFRTVTLPDGWSKQGSDHDMWSYVVDPLGRQRVAVFYKAAWYDRSAFCRVETVGSYLSAVAYEGGEPVVDDEWATPEALTVAANSYVARAQETIELYSRRDVVEREPKYAAERVAESKRRIAWAEALIAKLAGAA